MLFLRARLTQNPWLGLLVPLAFGMAGPAAAGSIAVTTTSDEMDGDCDDGDCSLRDAIALAGPGGAVVVPAGVYTLTLGSELLIDTDLSLSGAGPQSTTLQAASAPGSATWRVLHVASGQVAVSGMTLRYGAGVPNGAGILNEGTLTLDGCIVTENQAIGCSNCTRDGTDGGPAHGGGIYDGGSLSLTSTSVTNNRAQGGAGSDEGGNGLGGGVYSQGHLTLIQSTVHGNLAMGGDALFGGTGFGGGIHVTSTSGTSAVEVDRSTISSNSVGISSGALFPGAGGGIYHAVAGAGAAGNLTLSNSTVSGNNIDGIGTGPLSRGGGILLAASNDASSLLVLSNATIANNTAADRGAGGGLYVLADSGGTPVVQSKNSILAMNQADPGPDCFTSGASLMSAGHNLIQDISGCLVSTGSTGDIIGESPLLGPLSDNGGATLTHALQHGSPALDAGSDELPGSGDGACEATDQLDVPRPVNGDGDGLAICDIGALESAFLASPTPTSTPTATQIPIPTATVTQTPTATPTRAVLEARFVATSGVDTGACLDPLQPCRTISYAVTQALPADTIEIAPGSYTDNVLVDRDLTISGSSAESTIIDGNGNGRVFVVPAGRTLMMSGLSLINGSAQSGGGVFNQGSLTLERCILRDNRARSAFGLGGSLYNKGAVILKQCIIRNNSALGTDGKTSQRPDDVPARGELTEGSASGGGIQNDGTAVIEDCAILENTAQPGLTVIPGAGFGGGVRNTGVMTIDTSLISANSALGGEGAHEEQKSGAGGGISSTGQLILRNVTINGNVAGIVGADGGPGDGGGLHVRGAPSTPTTVELSNVTISENQAEVSGGGFHGDSTAASIEVRFRNTIVASNRSGSRNPDCNGTLISEGYNLIGDASGCTVTGDATGNILEVDPALFPLGDNGGQTQTQALQPQSPALDAGSPELPGTSSSACEPEDQRGRARPADGDGDATPRCDMGAFEKQPDESTTLGLNGLAASGIPALGLMLLWLVRRRKSGRCSTLVVPQSALS